jgi:hypothetical protein
VKRIVVYSISVLNAFTDFEGITIDYIQKYLYEYEHYSHYRTPVFRNKIITAFLEDNKLDPNMIIIVDVEPTDFIMSNKHATNPNNEDPKLN